MNNNNNNNNPTNFDYMNQILASILLLIGFGSLLSILLVSPDIEVNRYSIAINACTGLIMIGSTYLSNRKN